MAVTITGDRESAVGTPVALFDTAIPFPRNDTSQAARSYDVTADGQRFLINVPRSQTNASPITVVLNWTAGVKR
jgi:hypothetical protein